MKRGEVGKCKDCVGGGGAKGAGDENSDFSVYGH